MAIKIETISDSRDARADIAKLRASVEGIRQNTEKATQGFASMTKGIVAAATAMLSFSLGISKLDQFTNLENKLRTVTDGSNEFAKSLSNVKRIAMDTRTDLTATATLYSKVALAGKRYNVTQAALANFTKSIGQTLAISGATAAESTSAILQLGQGLASNRLAGEELRAVFESAPVFALNLAKGLNVPFGNLRKMAEEGELTFSTVFNAIQKQQKRISEDFKKLNITYAGAFTNMGTALSLVFKNFSDSVFGEGAGLASKINDVAMSIFDIAENLKAYVNGAKLSINLLIADIYFGFIHLKRIAATPFEKAVRIATSLREVFKSISVQAKTFLSGFDDTLKTLERTKNSIVSFFKTVIDTVFIGVVGATYFLIDKIAVVFRGLKEIVLNNFKDAFSALPSIEVSKFFPDLDKALGFVKDFAVKAERWFFWLYDQVIGHSWIPDTVKETVSWLAKLLGKPLSYISTFVKSASSGFGKLLLVFPPLLYFTKMFGSAFLRVAGIVLRFGTIFGAIQLGIIGLITLVNTLSSVSSKVDVGSATKSINSKGLDSSAKALSKSFNEVVKPSAIASNVKLLDKIKNKFSELRETISKITQTAFDSMPENVRKSFVAIGASIKSVFEDIKGYIEKIFITLNQTAFVRTFKQVYGIKDTYKGFLSGEQIDNTSEVGRGTHRKDSERPLGHDTYFAFPEGAREVIKKAIYLAVNVGLLLAIVSSGFRVAIGRALALGFGVAFAAGLTNTTVGNALSSLARRFIDTLATGIKDLAVNNPLMLASIVGKILFLFKSGREMMMTIAKQIVTAPMSLGKVAGQAYELSTTTKAITKIDVQLAALAIRSKQANGAAEHASQTAGDRLSQRMYRGKPITPADLQRFKDSGSQNPNHFGKRNAPYVADMISANKMTERLVQESERQTKELTDTRKLNEDQVKYLKTQAQARREAVKDSVSQVGGALGGAIGASYAYDMGHKIAGGMTNSPEWAKVAVSLSSGVIGTGVGSVLGATAARLILEGVVKAVDGITEALSYTFDGIFKKLIPYLATSLWNSSKWVKIALVFAGVLITAGLYIRKGIEESLNNLKAPETSIDTLTAKLAASNARLNSLLEDPNGNSALIRDEIRLREALTSSLQANLDKYEKAYDLRSLAAGKTAPVEKRLEVALQLPIEQRPAITGVAPLADNAVSDFAGRIGTTLGTWYKDSIFGKEPEWFTGGKVQIDDKGIIENSTTNTQLLLERLSGGAGSSGTEKRALGGHITGAGTGTSDSIPAMLSNGEFVINAESTKQNRGLLERINNGLPAFKDGGLVSGEYLNDMSFPVARDLANSDMLKYISRGNVTVIRAEDPSDSKAKIGGPTGFQITIPKLKKGLVDQGYLTGMHEIGHLFHLKAIAPTLVSNLTKDPSKKLASDVVAERYSGLYGRQTAPEYRSYLQSYPDSESRATVMAMLTQLEMAIPDDSINTPIRSIFPYRQDESDEYLEKHYAFFDKQMDFRDTVSDFVESSMLSDIAKLVESNPEIAELKVFRETPTLEREAQATKWALDHAKWLEPDALAQVALGYRTYMSNQSDFKSQFTTEGLYDYAMDFADDAKLNKSFNGDASSFKPLKANAEFGWPETERARLAAYLPQFATGGFVSGPGSGTSDDIPAMLSNGEFVINAKASKDNANILHAINSGKKVGYFAGGKTGPTSAIAADVLDVNIVGGSTDFLGLLSSTFDNILGSEFGSQISDLVSAITGAFSPNENSYAYKVNNAADQNTSIDLIKKGFGELKALGVTGLNSVSDRDMKNLTKDQGADIGKAITSLKEGVADLRKYAANGVPANNWKVINLKESMRGQVNSINEIASSGSLSGGDAGPSKEMDTRTLMEQFNELTTSFPDLSISFKEFLGVGETARNIFAVSAGNIKAAMSDLKGLAPGSPELAGVDVTYDALHAAIESTTPVFQLSVDRIRMGLAGMLANLGDVGVTFSKELYTQMTSRERANVNSYAQAIKDQVAILAGEPTPEQVLAAKEIMRNAREGIDKSLSNVTDTAGSRASAAGISFADGIHSDIRTSLVDSLKGTGDTDFLDNAMDSLTNGIITTFVDGLTGPLTSPEGPLGQLFKSIGSSVFDLGEGSPKAGSSGQSGSWVSAISSMFMADGGHVRGGGTGTSDSIPAMLSNGEFVINAKATKEHFALLSAVNSGKRLRAFAAGGSVTSSSTRAPTLAQIKSPYNGDKASSEQVFNINITGDVSRQTRSHIMSMIPQIASGVNSHNHEALRR
jgi:tape measure domain-containing protein